ncbi:MAG: hypothetical protein ABI131_07250, partial [Nostocoides sp.]
VLPPAERLPAGTHDVLVAPRSQPTGGLFVLPDKVWASGVLLDAPAASTGEARAASPWFIFVGTGVASDGKVVFRSSPRRDLILRTDIRTGESLPSFTVPAGTYPQGLLYAGGSLWVAARDVSAVLRLDPTSGKVGGQVAGRASGLQWAFGNLWISTTDSVLRVDPATLAVKATIALPPTLGQPAGMAATATSVWVAGSGVLFRIDARTNTLTKIVTMDGTAYGPLADGSTVWLVAGNDITTGGTVKPASLLQLRDDGTVAHRYPLAAGEIDGGLALAGGRLWVLAYDFARLTVVPLPR